MMRNPIIIKKINTAVIGKSSAKGTERSFAFFRELS
jgi:hypothetical protein